MTDSAYDIAFRRWWDDDYSWSGLKKRDCSVPGKGKLADYWDIDEADLIECGGRTWTRFHLPMHDLNGLPSKKADWNTADVKLMLDDITQLILAAPFAEPIENAVGSNPDEPLEPDFDVDLSGIVFPTSFELAEVVGKRIDFKAAVFSKELVIRNCELESLRLARGLFREWTQLSNTSVAGIGYFKAACFLGDVHIGPGVTFGGHAFFRDAHFHDRTFFWALEAHGETSFWRAEFEDDAHFLDCRFAKKTVFRRTAFRADARFAGRPPEPVPSHQPPDGVTGYGACRFAEEVNFSGDRDLPFGSDTDFSGVVFCKDVDFHGRTFSGNVSFSNAHFKEAAFFHDCTLPDNVNFSAQFSAQAPMGDGRDKRELELEQAYRTLRRVARDHVHHERELKFAQLEFAARLRRRDNPMSDRAVIRLFRFLSRYSGSFGRPLAVWLIFTTLGWTSLWISLCLRDFGTLGLLSDYFRFCWTVAPMVLPTPIAGSVGQLSEAAASLDMLERDLRVFAALQFLWSTGMFTLFVLALRRRFVLPST